MSQRGRPPSKSSNKSGPRSGPAPRPRSPGAGASRPANVRPGPPPNKQRRSLSTVSAGGTITRSGVARVSEALADALAEGRRDSEIALSVTHPLHTYPARMHPGTARILLELTAGGLGEGARILDPFCGSGTTMVESRYIGAEAIGIDINPLAVMIARAKTWTVPLARRRELQDMSDAIASASRTEVKAARRSGYEGSGFRTPEGVDRKKRDAALRNWFAPHVRRELEFLAAAIDDAYESDAQVGTILKVILSSLLYKVSRRASDTDPSKVERNIARGAATRLFSERMRLLQAGLDELAQAAKAPLPTIHRADARELASIVEHGTIDAVITSPPYMGTYDYRAQHELRLVFLGLPIDDFDSREMGARRHFQVGEGGGGAKARAAWQASLGAVLDGIGKVLRPEGQAVIMIGDSVAAGRAVRADEDIKELATAANLQVVATASQTRPLTSVTERHVFSGEPKREHLLLLERRPSRG